MQLNTLLPVLLSTLSLTTAATLGQPSTYTSNTLDIGSSPGGVAWRFNISAPSSENTPGFKTHCEGTSYNVTLCTDKNISARLKPLGYPKFNLWVEHRWGGVEAADDTRSQSGSVNVTESTKSFRIHPDVFKGAW